MGRVPAMTVPPAGVVDSALGKGLRVMEALATAEGPVRLSHLAADLGLQKSSVHRALRSLIDLGYASQDPGTELYTATLKVWELGAVVVSALPIKRAATTILHELHRSTGETVSLSVLDGDDVLYLDKLLSPRPGGFTTRVGSRVPAPFTAAGRAMLAFEYDPDAVIERVASAVKPGALDVDKARADVRQARESGFVAWHGRPERGVVAIAVAVPGSDGRAAAGLTVSAPSRRLDEKRRDEIVDALSTAAAGLAEALGAR